MEINELQGIWDRYDTRLREHINLNKKLFRELLHIKTEKRLSHIRARALFDLLLPIPILLYLIFTFSPRSDVLYYVGLFTGLPCFFLTWYFAFRHYQLSGRIDLSKTLTALKKDIKTMELYKLRTRKISLMLAPVFVLAIFLYAGMPFLERSMLPFYLAVAGVMLITAFVSRHYGFRARISKLNEEIGELEDLEGNGKEETIL